MEAKRKVWIVFGAETAYEWTCKNEDDAEKLLEELATRKVVQLRYSDTGQVACVINTNNMAYAYRR